jgi:hypothetical protein
VCELLDTCGTLERAQSARWREAEGPSPSGIPSLSMFPPKIETEMYETEV